MLNRFCFLVHLTDKLEYNNVLQLRYLLVVKCFSYASINKKQNTFSTKSRYSKICFVIYF